MLFSNFGNVHGFKKNLPGGRLTAYIASHPFDKPSLHSFLLIQGVVPKALFYLGCITQQHFQKCPPLACSFAAHMFSEEHEMVQTFCGKGQRQSCSWPYYTFRRMIATTRDHICCMYYVYQSFFLLPLYESHVLSLLSHSPFTFCDKMDTLTDCA